MNSAHPYASIVGHGCPHHLLATSRIDRDQFSTDWTASPKSAETSTPPNSPAQVVRPDGRTRPDAGCSIPDLDESGRFANLWCDMTGATHLTLTAIVPDGPASTRTFGRRDERMSEWIAQLQGRGANVYFQPNETRSDCTKKPDKAAMVAALCRHADVDPDDDKLSLDEERGRLHRLAEFLKAESTFPPSVIIDSGNGLQPLWVVSREPLEPHVVDRVERENRQIEAALGAAGTHDVSRLLRMPGTLNFPNAKERSRGRVSRCRREVCGNSVWHRLR